MPAARRTTQYSHSGAAMTHQDQSAQPISLAPISANAASKIQTSQFTGAAPYGYADFPYTLRNLFVTILADTTIGDVKKLFDMFAEAMTEDFTRKERTRLSMFLINFVDV